MIENIDDHSKCDMKACSWPKYHEHSGNIMKGKLKDLTVVSNEGEPANRTLRSFLTRVTPDIPFNKRTENSLKEFISNLLDELYHVYREEDLKMIETTRPLTDWTGLAIRIKDRSIPIVHALEKKTICKKLQRSL